MKEMRQQSIWFMINPYAFIIMMRLFALMFFGFDHHDEAHHANACCALI